MAREPKKTVSSAYGANAAWAGHAGDNATITAIHTPDYEDVTWAFEAPAEK